MINSPRKAPGHAAMPARNALGPKYTSPNPIDIHVGGRLRQRRTLLGMSQEKLGDMLHLTFQQIQKYERGTNRIGASRLYELSVLLQVPVGYFFDGAPALGSQQAYGVAEEPAAPYDDPMTRRETLELIRCYYQIRDISVRRRILDLTRSLAGGMDEFGDPDTGHGPGAPVPDTSSRGAPSDAPDED